MLGRNSTRALLGAADPARNTPPAQPVENPAVLIALAGPDHATRPRVQRRLVPAIIATVLAVTVGAYAYDRSNVDSGGTRSPDVLVPVAYQIAEDPPNASAHLLALAGRITKTSYDGQSGAYSQHLIKRWGNPTSISDPDGYVMGMASEQRTWHRFDDCSGKQRITQLEPQYPDQASRDYYQGISGGLRLQPEPEAVTTVPPNPNRSLPTTEAAMIALLRPDNPGDPTAKAVAMLYTHYAIDLEIRALILKTLAGVPNTQWRGEVVDRAGRPGFAITWREPQFHSESLLIFDQATGELLAHERVSLGFERKVGTYTLILETARVDQMG